MPKGWLQAPLASLSSKKISYGIVQTGDNLPNGIPCLRVADLPNADIAKMIRTSPAINLAYTRTVLQKEDIVVALRGEIGLASMVTEEWAGFNITRGIARISPKKDQILPEFLLWELRSPRLRSDLLRRAGGSALQEISIGELRSVITMIPPVIEQKKIVEILSTWDQAIVFTEQFLMNCKQQKKALMQQLLTGNKRLSGFSKNWEYQSLGDWLVEYKENSGHNNQHEVLTSSRNGLIRQSDYFKEGRITNRDNQGFNIIPPGYITYRSRSDDGLFTFNQNNLGITGVISTYYPVFNFPKGDQDFFINLLLFKEKIFDAHSVGTSQKVLSINSLKSIKFKIPCVDEQKKIAAILSTADREIEAMQQKLYYLKQEKKALMQQLLTGKRRVKVEAA
ncbi:restriction endonuclease subunit S [Pseudomonas frederiksbergensis]|uniref:Restriction endonuclease subunit S n=1 Tax=Pseudomonas frederiksbergensis TaxID=104087 RepID=A0A2S8H9H4_9PSED|nr:restriction endonuclease subunit S [Pseudomonas frederiksbergensis]